MCSNGVKQMTTYLVMIGINFSPLKGPNNNIWLRHRERYTFDPNTVALYAILSVI